MNSLWYISENVMTETFEFCSHGIFFVFFTIEKKNSINS